MPLLICCCCCWLHNSCWGVDYHSYRRARGGAGGWHSRQVCWLWSDQKYSFAAGPQDRLRERLRACRIRDPQRGPGRHRFYERCPVHGRDTICCLGVQRWSAQDKQKTRRQKKIEAESRKKRRRKKKGRKKGKQIKSPNVGSWISLWSFGPFILSLSFSLLLFLVRCCNRSERERERERMNECWTLFLCLFYCFVCN